MTLIQAASIWAAAIAVGVTIFWFALTGRREQARRDRAYWSRRVDAMAVERTLNDPIRRTHAAGHVTDAGLDRLRAAIQAHTDGTP